MNIQVSKEAAEWYQHEMDLKQGDFVRFFVRYGGFSTVQKGFSLGISTDHPEDLAAKAVVNGVTFYVEEKDEWYFDGHDLSVSYNAQASEPEFHFQK